MAKNSFGQYFILHTFGESHGPAMGAIIDGCPSGVLFNQELLQKELDRRRPGQNSAVTDRKESDQAEVLSGVYQGKTLGTPISVIIRNKDFRSEDYQDIQNQPRIGHADQVWKDKFGHTDLRGGGRSSGRETVSRVIGGTIARMFILQQLPHLKIHVFADRIGSYVLSEKEEHEHISGFQKTDDYSLRFPSVQHDQVFRMLEEAKQNGESYGGSVRVIIQNMPKGLGQPVFHKLKADFASALMSIGATSGFEVGEGFESSGMKGTDFHQGSQNVYGGIQGGVSTGYDISMRLSFKPTSSILDVAKKGRHDPCIIPRAVPVVESMINLVIADHLLWSRTDKS